MTVARSRVLVVVPHHGIRGMPHSRSPLEKMERWRSSFTKPSCISEPPTFSR